MAAFDDTFTHKNWTAHNRKVIFRGLCLTFRKLLKEKKILYWGTWYLKSDDKNVYCWWLH